LLVYKSITKTRIMDLLYKIRLPNDIINSIINQHNIIYKYGKYKINTRDFEQLYKKREKPIIINSSDQVNYYIEKRISIPIPNINKKIYIKYHYHNCMPKIIYIYMM
jgi:hypothetical protein